MIETFTEQIKDELVDQAAEHVLNLMDLKSEDHIPEGQLKAVDDTVRGWNVFSAEIARAYAMRDVSQAVKVGEVYVRASHNQVRLNNTTGMISLRRAILASSGERLSPTVAKTLKTEAEIDLLELCARRTALLIATGEKSAEEVISGRSQSNSYELVNWTTEHLPIFTNKPIDPPVPDFTDFNRLNGQLPEMEAGEK